MQSKSINTVHADMETHKMNKQTKNIPVPLAVQPLVALCQGALYPAAMESCWVVAGPWGGFPWEGSGVVFLVAPSNPKKVGMPESVLCKTNNLWTTLWVETISKKKKNIYMWWKPLTLTYIWGRYCCRRYSWIRSCLALPSTSLWRRLQRASNIKR